MSRKIFTLSPRLQKCADFVRDGAYFADIGTDHGYLPIYLLLSEKINSAIAADIGEKPLSYARQNAEKYRTELKTILSDGFENIVSEDFTDACLAGMGGELMVKILSDAVFLKDVPLHGFSTRRLILEPQSHEHELRQFLSDNGWEIIKEEACLDSGKIYTVIAAEPSENSQLSDAELYMGKLSPNDEFSKIYAEVHIKKLRYHLRGMAEGSTEKARTLKIINDIEEKYLKCPQ